MKLHTKRMKVTVVLICISLSLGVAYGALSFGAQTLTFQYVPVRTFPLTTVDLGNVTTDDVMVLNRTLPNTNNFDLNVTYAVSSPGLALGVVRIATVSSWPENTFRVLKAKQNINVTMTVMFGIPPLPDIPFRGNVSFVFYGCKVVPAKRTCP